MPEKNFDSLSLVLDIETTAIDDAGDYLEPATPPANYKDPAKIEAYIQEKTADRLAAASLDPDLNRIVALGFQLEDRDVEPVVHLCRDEREERLALEAFWTLVASDGNATRRLITFAGFSFDLPVLMRRSLYLRIWPSRVLSVDRYRSQHVDLLQVLSFNGMIRAHSLAFYARRLGFAIERPELTGSDIAARVQAGDWSAVAAHCASDVQLTYQLAARLGYLEADEDEDHETAVGW